MIKVTWKTENADITVEGTTQKEVMKQLAENVEIFGVSHCEACKGKYKPVVRTVPDPKNPKKSYEYYEFRCLNKKCLARLSLGQSNEGGGLFPKRKDANGNYLDHGGWEIYKKEGKTQKKKDNEEDEQIPF